MPGGALVVVAVGLSLLCQAVIELGCAARRHRQLTASREVRALATCGTLSLIILAALAVSMEDPAERRHLAWIVLAAFLARDVTKAVYRRSLRSGVVAGTGRSLDPRSGS